MVSGAPRGRVTLGDGGLGDGGLCPPPGRGTLATCTELPRHRRPVVPARSLSLAALTILDAGPAGQIRAAAEAGWCSVGLRLMPLLASDRHVVGSPEAEAELMGLIEQTGLSVLEIGVFPVKPVMDWELIERVVAFSAGIGARHLVCPVEDANDARRLVAVRRLADLAAAHGMTALVEFNPYSACTTLAAALDLVRQSQRDNAGLVIDVLHLSRSGGSPEDLVGVEPGLIRLVHLCDAPPPPERTRPVDELRTESRTARMLPGEGALWLDRLLDVLPPATPLSIEAPSARLAHLSATERARCALAATRAFLDRKAL
jgi:sugar phosphate isomerase/epimerase